MVYNIVCLEITHKHTITKKNKRFCSGNLNLRITVHAYYFEAKTRPNYEQNEDSNLSNYKGISIKAFYELTNMKAKKKPYIYCSIDRVYFLSV